MPYVYLDRPGEVVDRSRDDDDGALFSVLRPFVRSFEPAQRQRRSPTLNDSAEGAAAAAAPRASKGACFVASATADSHHLPFYNFHDIALLLPEAQQGGGGRSEWGLSCCVLCVV